MYVSTAESRKGFPVLDHPRVDNQRSRTRARPGKGPYYAVLGAEGNHPRVESAHITSVHNPGGPGKGPYYAVRGTEGNHPRVESAHITLAHKRAVPGEGTHYLFTVQREMVALDQDHI